MALTYYIRSWDPRSTYPTNPQEGDICYTITLDQTWAPVGGVKKDNIVKEEIYQNGAWVEQGGGGGDSIRHAKVTLTIDGAGGLDVKDIDGTYVNLFETEDGFQMSVIAEEAGTTTHDLALFKEETPGLLTITGNYVSSTGDCEWDAVEEVLSVSGDCTVTVESTD